MTFSWYFRLGLLVLTLLNLMPLTPCCLLILHSTGKCQSFYAQNFYHFCRVMLCHPAPQQTADERHNSALCFDMVDTALAVVCYAWSVWWRVPHTQALTHRNVVSRNPSQRWVWHIFCLPNLLKFHSVIWVNSRGVVHVPFRHTWRRNCPPRVWRKLVSTCASKIPV